MHITDNTMLSTINPPKVNDHRNPPLQRPNSRNLFTRSHVFVFEILDHAGIFSCVLRRRIPPFSLYWEARCAAIPEDAMEKPAHKAKFSIGKSGVSGMPPRRNEHGWNVGSKMRIFGWAAEAPSLLSIRGSRGDKGKNRAILGSGKNRGILGSEKNRMILGSGYTTPEAVKMSV